LGEPLRFGASLLTRVGLSATSPATGLRLSAGGFASIPLANCALRARYAQKKNKARMLVFK
jgi:hypothetical protein